MLVLAEIKSGGGSEVTRAAPSVAHHAAARGSRVCVVDTNQSVRDSINQPARQHKADIEAFGVERFVRCCLDSVFRYTAEWEEMTRRLGFWVDLDGAYVTYHRRYVESVWWSLKTLFERGLLYQGDKIVWWWAQGGTALSAGEIGEGYRMVEDPSLYLKLPLLDDVPGVAPSTPTSLVAWTTTPWTLPSNHFAAVRSDLDYAVVADGATGERLVLAAAAVPSLEGKVGRPLAILATVPGRSLVGLPAGVGGEYPLPFRSCVVLGHLMGEDGTKMSKRLRNYREPSEIFDTLGADAMRWYFLSAQAPWNSARFQKNAIAEAQRELLVRLQNVTSFFVIYANLDGFEPGQHARPVAERSELDRWLMSELHGTVAAVRADLDRLENQPAARRIAEFVDALSNWWVRRSRARFWSAERGPTTWDAYETLHECLLTLSRLIAPFTPLFAETMWQALTGAGFRGEPGDRPISVHLAEYPVPDRTLVDPALARDMELVRDLVSAGHTARNAAKLRVRQPLAAGVVVLSRPDDAERLARHAALVREELNLKAVEFTTDPTQGVRFTIKPDMKRLGQRLGRLLPELRARLAGLDGAGVRRHLEADGRLTIELGGVRTTLTAEDLFVRAEALAGWSLATGRYGTVAVSTVLTPALAEEGLIREFLHHVQAARKAQELAYDASVTLRLSAPAALEEMLRRWQPTIAAEALVAAFEFGVVVGEARTADLGPAEVRFTIEPREVS